MYNVFGVLYYMYKINVWHVLNYHLFHFLLLQLWSYHLQWHCSWCWWPRCQAELVAEMLDDVLICRLILYNICMFSSLSLFAHYDLSLVYTLFF